MKLIQKNGIYEGAVDSKNKPHGFGKKTWNNGDIYEGEWSHGIRTGYGIYHFAKSGNRYEGDFVDKLMSGKGKMYYANGNTYEGDWVDNYRTGYGIFTYKNGKVIEGYFENNKLVKKEKKEISTSINESKNIKISFGQNEYYEGEANSKGEPHGIGTYYFKDGSKYIGEYKNGSRHGNGKITYPNGNYFEGNFDGFTIKGIGTAFYPGRKKYLKGTWEGFDLINERINFVSEKGDRYLGQCIYSELNGNGKMYYADGSEYNGDFKHGKRHGYGTYYTREDGLYDYTGDWQDNLPHGIGTFYYKNGDIYTGEIKEGLENGKGVYTYKNYVFEGYFINGKKTGYGICKFNDGDTLDCKFVNDICEGHGILRKANGYIYDGEFKNGSFHGYGIENFPDGSIYKGEFLNDKRCGKGEYYWPSGDRYIGEFKNGKMNGKGRMYHRNGSILDGNWKDDKFIG